MIGLPEVLILSALAGALLGLYWAADRIGKWWHGRHHTTRENIIHIMRVEGRRGYQE